MRSSPRPDRRGGSSGGGGCGQGACSMRSRRPGGRVVLVILPLSGHAQAAVAGEDEPPPGREGLEPVAGGTGSRGCRSPSDPRDTGPRGRGRPGRPAVPAGMAAGAILVLPKRRCAGRSVPVDRGGRSRTAQPHPAAGPSPGWSEQPRRAIRASSARPVVASSAPSAPVMLIRRTHRSAPGVRPGTPRPAARAAPAVRGGDRLSVHLRRPDGRHWREGSGIVTSRTAVTAAGRCPMNAGSAPRA